MTTLLEWHNLIFLAPFVMGAVLLLVGSMPGFGHLRGHHGGVGMGHGHAAILHGAAGSGHAGAAQAGSAHVGTAHAGLAHHGVGHAGHFPHAHAGKLAGGDGEQGVSLIAFTLGLHKAPLPFLLQTWLLLWGVVGLAANKIWMQGGHPFGLAIVPSVLVAFFAASLGTRLTAEVTFKLLPQDETYDVSQDALFGLVGDVAYRVTESTGRILVYDDFGTLHDEHCRVKPGSQAIEKGESAMVVERDPTSGCLLVQITAEPPKG